MEFKLKYDKNLTFYNFIINIFHFFSIIFLYGYPIAIIVLITGSLFRNENDFITHIFWLMTILWFLLIIEAVLFQNGIIKTNVNQFIKKYEKSISKYLSILSFLSYIAIILIYDSDIKIDNYMAEKITIYVCSYLLGISILIIRILETNKKYKK